MMVLWSFLGHKQDRGFRAWLWFYRGCRDFEEGAKQSLARHGKVEQRTNFVLFIVAVILSFISYIVIVPETSPDFSQTSPNCPYP